ncbi:MAG: L-threonylcarbamoyladenylate synthase [bacterium]|nr:L-threonylcarbamoyladenylate synthase [bacterium]
MPIVSATEKNINKAAAIIREGGIAAFPTETVYGLGANAFDAKAVKKIFKAKGRPQDNPVIVHIVDKRDLSLVAASIPPVAKKLIAKFWPGPLTLILPRNKNVPSIVSAGLDTVAVRMPAHQIARALIKKAGVPVAAPSANKSGRPSPTDAHHVTRDFGKTLFILDGGRTKIGLESTVVDCTVSPPVILRHGGVTFEELRHVVPTVRILKKGDVNAPAKSPGMKYRHYAPKAPLVIAEGSGAAMRKNIAQLIRSSKGKRVGILATEESLPYYMALGDRRIITLALGSRNNMRACARRLFAVLRKFDTLNVDLIITESFPEKGIGAAMMERLRRASAPPDSHY